jgi:hypothetical protein
MRRAARSSSPSPRRPSRSALDGLSAAKPIPSDASCPRSSRASTLQVFGLILRSTQRARLEGLRPPSPSRRPLRGLLRMRAELSRCDSGSPLSRGRAEFAAAPARPIRNRILIIIPPPSRDPLRSSRLVQGAFHERHETRGGMRWPCGAKDVSRRAEAQVVWSRLR